MVIQINDTRTIGDIQQDFQQAFPHLKLEFFSEPHHQGEGTPKRLHIGAQTQIANLRALHNNGYLSLSPDLTAAQLEEHLRDYYGLNAQVFRKQGENWVETTRTDEWSLARHNEVSEEFATREPDTRTEEQDIHEQM